MPLARPALRTAIALALAALLALTLAPTLVGAAGAQEAGAQPRVVVAVPDSFTNPYHAYFHQGGPLYGDTAPSSVTPAVLEEFGIGEDQIIRLTRTGNFEADFAADQAQFEAIERGKPYWFEGTNIIGISFREEGEGYLRPDGDQSPHGVGTTASVLEANPEAIIVSVDDFNAESETWAMTHPAIDVLTTSYGPIGSPPTLEHLTASYTGVVVNGKHHFGAVDNTPAFSPFDATGGPWWTIGISGFQEDESEGRQPLSGSYPDFVGDFTRALPYCRSCEGTEEADYRTVSGTSFATPRSAGTFSKVLLEARRAAGHTGGIVTEGVDQPLMVSGNGIALTNWQFRRAMEESAYYPTFSEYDPTTGRTAVPPADAAPYLTYSWGAITPDPEHQVIEQTLAHVGIAGEIERTKSAGACDFMTANIEFRHVYWDRVAVNSESFGTSEDPYLYCPAAAVEGESPGEGTGGASQQGGESGSDSSSRQPGDPGVSRIDGPGGTATDPAAVRATAIDLSRAAVAEDGGASSVLLGRDDVFADSLAGAPLAGDDSVILYTPGGPDAALDPAVRAEIDRVLPDGAPVRLLGGSQAVSAGVERELTEAGYAVERFSGETRVQTAVQLAEAVRQERGATGDALVAYAYDWPDAVTAGAWGAATGTPVLLTGTEELHPSTQAALQQFGTTRTVVTGGPAVISDAAANAAPGAVRVAGANRMGTAVEVADELWAPTLGRQPQALVAVNLFHEAGWSLALAAAPLSAALDAPQLGVATDEMPPETVAYLDRAQFDDVPPVVVVGNAGFISEEVAERLDAAVRD